MNLDWIPPDIIDFELSQKELFIAKCENTESKYIIIITFLSGKSLTININKDEYLLSLKKWLLTLSNLNRYDIKLIYNTEILNDYLGTLKLIDIFNSDKTINLVCMLNVKINNKIDAICTCAYEDTEYEDGLYHQANLNCTFSDMSFTCGCGCGLLIPKDIDPFNITFIPEKYKSIISDIEWSVFKIKLSKRIDNYLEYLDLSDDDLDSIIEVLREDCSKCYISSNPYDYYTTLTGKYFTYVINCDLMFDNILLSEEIKEKMKDKYIYRRFNQR